MVAALEYIVVVVVDWVRQYRLQVLSEVPVAVVAYHRVVAAAWENVHSDRDQYLDLDDDNVHKRDDVHLVAVHLRDFVHIHLFADVLRDSVGRQGHQDHPVDGASVVVDAVVDVDGNVILPLLGHRLAVHMHVELFVVVDHCRYLMRVDHQHAVHCLLLSWVAPDHRELRYRDHHYHHYQVLQIRLNRRVRSVVLHRLLQLHHPARRVILFSHSLLVLINPSGIFCSQLLS